MSKAGQGEVKNVKANIGLSFPNTAIIFEKAEGTSINLIGKSKGKASSPPQTLCSPHTLFRVFRKLYIRIHAIVVVKVA